MTEVSLQTRQKYTTRLFGFILEATAYFIILAIVGVLFNLYLKTKFPESGTSLTLLVLTVTYILSWILALVRLRHIQAKQKINNQ